MPTLSQTYLDEHGWEVLRDFAALLRIPNVTGDVEELRRNATELKIRFEQRGAAMDVVELEGASPVVVGELRTTNPTATVGVYVHYDGQPVDASRWTFEPFSATLTTGPIHTGG